MVLLIQFHTVQCEKKKHQLVQEPNYQNALATFQAKHNNLYLK